LVFLTAVKKTCCGNEYQSDMQARLYKMMNIIPYPKTVFILEEDSALSQSLKCLLETHERIVRIFNNYDAFFSENVHTDSDIVMVNFDHENDNQFALLNRLLNMARRPEIIITSTDKSGFQRGDRFWGERVTILFHPFSPKELVRTVAKL
jgi:two-component SAPR family response regulator